jgi:hypothetical protein
MFDESRVIVAAMLLLMRNDVPSLAVHDSLIVPEQHGLGSAHLVRRGLALLGEPRRTAAGRPRAENGTTGTGRTQTHMKRPRPKCALRVPEAAHGSPPREGQRGGAREFHRS